MPSEPPSVYSSAISFRTDAGLDIGTLVRFDRAVLVTCAIGVVSRLPGPYEWAVPRDGSLASARERCLRMSCVFADPGYAAMCADAREEFFGDRMHAAPFGTSVLRPHVPVSGAVITDDDRLVALPRILQEMRGLTETWLAADRAAGTGGAVTVGDLMASVAPAVDAALACDVGAVDALSALVDWGRLAGAR